MVRKQQNLLSAFHFPLSAKKFRRVDLDERNCPLCGESSKKMIMDLGGWHIVRCPNCEFIYADDNMPVDELKKHYDDCYEDTRRWAELLDKISVRRFTSLLKEMRSRTKVGKLVDIGCSFGAFLEAAEKDGWEAVGVELSENVARYATEEKHLNVVNVPLEQADFQENSFDAVTMWHTLEHVPDPMTTLHECARILKPGALIAVEVPNTSFQLAKSKAFSMLGKHGVGMEKGSHLNHFTAQSLKQVLEMAGFQGIEIIPGYGSAHTHHTLSLHLKESYGDLCRWMHDITGVHMGNTICAFAWKGVETPELEAEERPFVSVVVPAHNRKNALKKTLHALFKQDYPRDRFEIVVVDDCSTDGTDKMVASITHLSPVELKYVCSHSNMGPGASRNLGIRKARGQIIAFADGDIIPCSSWISSGMQPFLQSPTVGGVEGMTVPHNEGSITPFTHMTANTTGGRFPTCNMFYRKKVLEVVGGFDEAFYDRGSKVHFREDLDTAIAVMRRGFSIPFASDALASHPPHDPYLRRPIDLAKRYFHDPRLMQKHPRKWRKWIDPLKVGPWVVSMPRHKLYALYLAFAVSILPAWAFGDSTLSRAMIAGFAGCSLAVIALHVRGCRDCPAKDIVLAVPVALACPFVFAYSLGKGWARKNENGTDT